jgi:hypothetical protein
MYSQKLSSLGLAVLTSIALVVSVTSRRQQGPDPQCAGTSTKMWVAEGGAPVPPYPPPPKPPKRSLSTNAQAVLVAEGGAPVPPYPPPSNAKFVAA